MSTDNELKQIVKEKYAEIARESSGCCGTKKNADYTIIKDEYKGMEGYVADADLNLGCGLPTESAGIKKGDVVVDLGSGAGNDVFVARALTGPEGRVIGIDMTPEMIAKANRNKEKLGFTNIDFYLGEIEDLPLQNNSADVVISNCVLNLVPGKQKAFSEIYRVLKPGAHFCVSDIVIIGDLPEQLKKDAAMYAGCVSGALQQDDYLKIISDTGFKGIKVVKSKTVNLPQDILKQYLSDDEIKDLDKKLKGIYSITVVAEKPKSGGCC